MQGVLCSVVLLVLIVCLQGHGDLYSHIRPTHYWIHLKTDFKTWVYTGNVKMAITVKKETQSIKLHATDRVNIQSINLYKTINKSGKVGDKIQSLKVGSRLLDSKDLLEFKLDKILPPGKYGIVAMISSKVSEKITGFYQTGYKNSKGKQIAMMATHLSPDKARTVFPCFDEPQFRAQFKLTLDHPSSLHATSNMPIESEKSVGKAVTRTVFQFSPSMSTYLLAWVCHDFSSKSAVWENVKITHHTRPSRTKHIPEKIKLFGQSIKYFNDYFGLKYPLPKLDTIGIPNYLVGGMENWGLITLSEGTALSAPDDRYGTSELAMRTLFTHEVSHMWFGNLVTMTWWNDLWLKEGMATYLSYPACGHIYKDIDMGQIFAAQVWSRAMQVDSVVTSHPVQMEIKTTKQITQIFDSVTYKKGALVLSMLKELLGEKKFKAGMKHFLETYQYSVAEYSNLVSSMTKQKPGAAKTITMFMDRYILQKNFPLITLKIMDDDQTIKLTQSRFVRASGMKGNDDKSRYGYQWYVPITVVTDMFTVRTPFMLKDESKVYKLPKSFKWIKLNQGGRMMYVTHYPNKIWVALKQELFNNAKDSELNTLPPRDRATIIHDAFAVAQMDLLRLDFVFSLAKYLRYETHFLPWNMAYFHFKKIRQVMSPDLTHCFRRYIIHLLRGQWSDAKSKKHDNLTAEIRYTFLYRYLYLKPAGEKVKADQKKLEAAIKEYKAATKTERGELELHKTDTNDDAQVKMIGDTILKHPSNKSKRMLDFIHIYGEDNPKAVWSVYKDNYKIYNEQFGLAQFSYSNALKGLAKHQRDPATVAEIEKFFEKNSAGSGALGLQHGFEQAKFGFRFRKVQEPGLRRYLKKYCPA